MTYQQLYAGLSEIIEELESCTYPEAQIIPDDQVILTLSSILADIMFENDELNFQPKKIDA